MENTPLLEERLKYQPQLPEILRELEFLEPVDVERTTSVSHASEVEKLFPKTFGRRVVRFEKGEWKDHHRPLKVGVVLSGGQAAGGHNVITGLFDALQAMSDQSQLIGFLGGPSGIINNQYKELDRATLAPYRNTGGFDLIGAGRTKIETDEQLEAAFHNAQKLGLHGLVIIGGDDSNTNAAHLAEYFLEKGCSTRVVGVPKTIDGDLKNAWIETSFGFDTACKVYAEMIGNICRDALSAKKYTHFIKLMGRSASHIALECALQTQPNVTLIGEEVAAKKQTLKEITSEIADVVCRRSEEGKNFGVILIPEGLIEFIPEMGVLIRELNTLLETNPEHVVNKLSRHAKKTFKFLPSAIAEQLLMDRDPHGNVQVSHIATEQLLIHTVKAELKARKFKGAFSPVNHFLGYEGRASFPSNFDATYCYTLGYVSALLIGAGYTGYMSSVQGLTKPADQWGVGGHPITMMLGMEERKGKVKPVIRKALVDLEGAPFKYFEEHRAAWALEDAYRFPGPIQLFGPPHLCDETNLTLKLEQKKAVVPH